MVCVSNQLNGLAAVNMARSSTIAKMLLLWRNVFCTLIMVTLMALCKMDCWARPYAAPGFLSDRRLFPPVGDPFWDGYNKVAFQNADCTWLAANFRDTGSDAVMILFPAFTIHKEMWPNPQLQLQLAVDHNISSLSVDIAGRGESCGYEIGPGCTSTVMLAHPGSSAAVLLQTQMLSHSGHRRSRIWLQQLASSIACPVATPRGCLVRVLPAAVLYSAVQAS